MEKIEQFRQLGKKAKQLEGKLQTEEATKNALVMPFIQLLGYDVFNPHEVIPEFQAEAGVKKDSRVDYALCKNGKPIILIECKKQGAPLDKEAADQLKRYFPFVHSARFGVLTDGNAYRFFCDIEKENVMDESPYLELTLDSINEDMLAKLLTLEKSKFNEKETIDLAEELKYTKQFKVILSRQYESPEEEFLRFFAKKVWHAQINQYAKDKLTPLLKEAFRQWTEDRINSRLRKAFEDEEKETAANLVEDTTPTENELLALGIVKAILSAECAPNRLSLKVQANYTSVFLDEKRTRTIMRLYFRGEPLKIDLYGFLKVEPPFKIDQVSDIYKYAERIREIFNRYEHPESFKSEVIDEKTSPDDPSS